MTGRISMLRVPARVLLLVTLLLIPFGSGHARADTTATTNATLDVGLPSDTTFAVAITGADFGSVPYRSGSGYQNANGSIVVTVIDTRGTGTGWAVSMAASGDLTSNSSSIPIGALSFRKASVRGRADANSGGINRYAITMSTQAQPILTASIAQGAGVFDCTIDGTLRIPDGTSTGTYVTTLIVTLTSGS